MQADERYTDTLSMKFCKNLSQAKNIIEIDNAVTFLNLVQNGCPSKKSLVFSTKKFCKIDSTQSKYGPPNYRKLNVVKNQYTTTNTGWQIGDPKFYLENNQQKDHQELEEHKQIEQQLKNHLNLFEIKKMEKNDFVQCQKNFTKQFQNSNLMFDIPKNVSNKQLMKRIQTCHKNFEKIKHKNKFYVVYDKLKLFNLGSELKEQQESKYKDGLINKLEVFKDQNQIQFVKSDKFLDEINQIETESENSDEEQFRRKNFTIKKLKRSNSEQQKEIDEQLYRAKPLLNERIDLQNTKSQLLNNQIKIANEVELVYQNCNYPCEQLAKVQRREQSIYNRKFKKKDQIIQKLNLPNDFKQIIEYQFNQSHYIIDNKYQNKNKQQYYNPLRDKQFSLENIKGLLKSNQANETSKEYECENLKRLQQKRQILQEKFRKRTQSVTELPINNKFYTTQNSFKKKENS